MSLRPVPRETVSDTGRGFVGHLFTLLWRQTDTALLPGELPVSEFSNLSLAFIGGAQELQGRLVALLAETIALKSCCCSSDLCGGTDLCSGQCF